MKTKSLLVIRLEESGIESKKVGRITSRVNPLDSLFSKGSLSKDQYFAGRDYQHSFELSNLSNHARPSYEQVRSTKPFTYAPKKSQMKAYAEVIEAKTEISKHFRHLEILINIFETQRSIHWCEKNLGTNHRQIEEKIKTICKILVDLKKSNN